jgi:hypothetical protein
LTAAFSLCARPAAGVNDNASSTKNHPESPLRQAGCRHFFNKFDAISTSTRFKC